MGQADRSYSLHKWDWKTFQQIFGHNFDGPYTEYSLLSRVYVWVHNYVARVCVTELVVCV